MTATSTDTLLDAHAVADYLAAHPEFLGDHPELAASLTAPRATGKVASLAAYQLQALREKNVELERRLGELVAIAAENEQLMQRVHRLTVALLRANTLEVAARTVAAKLSADFRSEQVRLVLFGSLPALPRADWLLQLPSGRPALPEFADFLAGDEPRSGRLAPDMLQRLFGDNAARIQSAAVMRLGEEGLLAIGSQDPDRFQPGMGTLFLKMIAATITAAFARARDVA